MRVGRGSRPKSIAALCAALLAGCSYTFIYRGPKAPLPNDVIDCKDSQALPLADGAIAASYVVAGLGLGTGLIKPSDPAQEPPPPEVVVPASIAGAIVFALSARYGLRETARCFDLHQRYGGPQGAPPPFRPLPLR